MTRGPYTAQAKKTASCFNSDLVVTREKVSCQHHFYAFDPQTADIRNAASWRVRDMGQNYAAGVKLEHSLAEKTKMSIYNQ